MKCTAKKLAGGIFILSLLFSGCGRPTKKLEKHSGTDVSLFLNNDTSKYLNEVTSETGDMYGTVGHHGPAVENEWVGYRFFFNSSTSIDVYSKSESGLELKEYKWYPPKERQGKGCGVDMYRVGKTLGLGGVVLWADSLVYPVTVKQRIAKVGKGDGLAWMEMISKGVSYKGDNVDIKVKVTVFDTKRDALVEAEEMSGKNVQFATGINYHPGNEVIKNNNSIIVWGIHPEDVADTPVDLGSALIFNPNDFIVPKDDGTQIILVSKLTDKIKTHITSASSMEPVFKDAINFLKYVNKFKDDIN